jgi:16S rRNA pseudouridine516 synthase
LRLDRLLANLGYGSRAEVQALLREGLVHMDGAPLRDPARHVELGPRLPERLTVRGEALDPPAPLILMLHKPTGVVCAHREAGPLVYDLLPARWRMRKPALSSVGRLDKETSGLLLITDDGDYLHRVISPRRHVPKAYLATLAQPLSGAEGALFASGAMQLSGDGTPLLPATLEPLGPRSARLILAEGRYHQVRRMFAAVGNHVLTLHRERVGGLMLPSDLPPGAYRVLGADEAAAVFVH